MRVAVYARVSTDDKGQDPDTQLYALREFCQRAEWEIYKEYVDKARAKDYKHRMAWQSLLQDAKHREFKIVLVYKLDRAFRSVRECCNQLQEWDDRGIRFAASSQDIDTTTSMGRYFLQNMAAMAELESSIISDRVKAGIARTKAQGNHFGRKRKGFDWPVVKAQLESGIPIAKIARDLGYSRARIYRAIKEENWVSKKGCGNSGIITQ